MAKNDPYAVALRDLRRGLGDGKGRGGKDADAEWLAARWPGYLAKRAEKASPLTMCGEITAILGQGTPPAWFRRPEVTEQEREGLEKELSKQMEAKSKDGEFIDGVEQQIGSTHVLVEDLHTKAFARQESIKKRTQREFREMIGNMDHETLLAFWEKCQEEFGVSKQKQVVKENPKVEPLEDMQKKWRKEDQDDASTAVPDSEDDKASCSSEKTAVPGLVINVLTPSAQPPTPPSASRATPDGHDCKKYTKNCGGCHRCSKIVGIGQELNLFTGNTAQKEAQFLLCSPQYVLDAFHTFKEKGKPLSQTFLGLTKFFDEYTKPAL